ncbi:MAG: hypothetical protein IPF71_13545 [Rhodoferax sp.]|nr:hypothetical protein [Rhodoferax sp.]
MASIFSDWHRGQAMPEIYAPLGKSLATIPCAQTVNKRHSGEGFQCVSRWITIKRPWRLGLPAAQAHDVLKAFAVLVATKIESSSQQLTPG